LNPRPTALTRHPVALASNRHAPKDTPIVRQRRQTRASRPCLDRLPPAPKQHRSTIPSRSSNSLDADRRFAAPQLAASAVPEGNTSASGLWHSEPVGFPHRVSNTFHEATKSLAFSIRPSALSAGRLLHLVLSTLHKPPKRSATNVRPGARPAGLTSLAASRSQSPKEPTSVSIEGRTGPSHSTSSSGNPNDPPSSIRRHSNATCTLQIPKDLEQADEQANRPSHQSWHASSPEGLSTCTTQDDLPTLPVTRSRRSNRP
jgi:hypothetical protein